MTEIDFKARMAKLRAKEGPPSSTPGPKEPERYKFGRDEQGRENVRFIPIEIDFVEKCERAQLSYQGIPFNELSQFQRVVLTKLRNGRTNAIFHGKTGTGKTALCLMGLMYLYLAGKHVRVCRWSEIRVMYQPNFLASEGTNPRQLTSDFAKNEYLLIDELGHGNLNLVRATGPECQVLQDIISARDAVHNYTWITCNQSLDKLKDLYGAAVFSRMMREGSRYTVNFNNEKDFRTGGL